MLLREVIQSPGNFTGARDACSSPELPLATTLQVDEIGAYQKNSCRVKTQQRHNNAQTHARADTQRHRRTHEGTRTHKDKMTLRTHKASDSHTHTRTLSDSQDTNTDTVARNNSKQLLFWVGGPFGFAARLRAKPGLAQATGPEPEPSTSPASRSFS